MNTLEERLAAKDRNVSRLLVAEGDSWFDTPFAPDILDTLERFGFDVEECARASHTLRCMAQSKNQKNDVKELLLKLGKRGTPPKAILLSGGGNDFVDHLPTLLNDTNPNDPILNQKAVNKFLKRLKVDFVSWLKFVSDTCDDVFGKSNPIPIYFHGYAYVVPDGRGFLPFKSWLKGKFKRKGHTSLEQNIQAMEHFVDLFNGMLSDLCEINSRYHHIDLRKELTNDSSRYKDDWNDELHPTRAGYKKVTRKFEKAIMNT